MILLGKRTRKDIPVLRKCYSEFFPNEVCYASGSATNPNIFRLVLNGTHYIIRI